MVVCVGFVGVFLGFFFMWESGRLGAEVDKESIFGCKVFKTK